MRNNRTFSSGVLAVTLLAFIAAPSFAADAAFHVGGGAVYSSFHQPYYGIEANLNVTVKEVGDGFRVVGETSYFQTNTPAIEKQYATLYAVTERSLSADTASGWNNFFLATGVGGWNEFQVDTDNKDFASTLRFGWRNGVANAQVRYDRIWVDDGLTNYVDHFVGARLTIAGL